MKTEVGGEQRYTGSFSSRSTGLWEELKGRVIDVISARDEIERTWNTIDGCEDTKVWRSGSSDGEKM